MIGKPDECYICGHNGYDDRLELHHIFGGAANRKLSDKYGLTVMLCGNKCHRNGKYAVHVNKDVRHNLQKIAQEWFEDKYPDLDFVEIFGKNYK